VAYAFGALIVALVGIRRAQRFIAAILAIGWLWTGVAYHWMFFSTINPLARWFAVGFIVQGGLILVSGVFSDHLVFEWKSTKATILGAFLIFYAAILYPTIGHWTGHDYPHVPTFGLTPCPLTIFTIGTFWLATREIPWFVLIVPVIWSAIGGSAAILLQVPQDWMLLASGVVSMMLFKHQSTRADARSVHV
jgi:hypothetical protein